MDDADRRFRDLRDALDRTRHTLETVRVGLTEARKVVAHMEEDLGSIAQDYLHLEAVCQSAREILEEAGRSLDEAK